jgi:hypothetical protein
LLGDDPLPGGDALMVTTAQGPLALAPRARAGWHRYYGIGFDSRL